MPHIEINLVGKRTFCGYMMLDGSGKWIGIYDSAVIEVTAGTHTIQFSDSASAYSADKNYRHNRVFTETFAKDTLVTVTIFLSNGKRVIGLSRCGICEENAFFDIIC